MSRSPVSVALLRDFIEALRPTPFRFGYGFAWCDEHGRFELVEVVPCPCGCAGRETVGAVEN